MAELKRREKQEEKEAKARVLRQIEEDKIARRNVCILKSTLIPVTCYLPIMPIYFHFSIHKAL